MTVALANIRRLLATNESQAMLLRAKGRSGSGAYIR